MGVLLQNFLDGDNSRWVMIGMAALTILYVVVRPMLRRKKDPLERSPKLGLSQQRTVEREMNHVLVELSDMARQISAQLDTRAARLELLIQQADERLEALSAKVDSPPAAAAGSQQRRPVDPPPAPPDPHHLEVYELADRGHSSRAIAERLSRPSGEVELILALRQKR